jgi:hypothetical protein
MSAICLMPRQSRGRTANHHDATWMRLLWSEGPGGWYAPCPAASGVTSAAASAPAPPAVTATVSPQVLGGTRGPQVRTRWHTERLTGSTLQGLGGTRGTQVRTRGHTQPALTPHRRGPGAGPGPGARTDMAACGGTHRARAVSVPYRWLLWPPPSSMHCPLRLPPIDRFSDQSITLSDYWGWGCMMTNGRPEVPGTAQRPGIPRQEAQRPETQRPGPWPRPAVSSAG